MSDIAHLAATIFRKAAGRDRFVVGIAGPPGAGKSMLGQRLKELLAEAPAALVAMDGFHFDNAVLARRGQIRTKGAPETFDAAGVVHLVTRIFEGETDVVYPVFDRRRDLSIAGAAVLDPDVEFVLFEGNYLLLQDDPWAQLSRFWTRTIWVDAPFDDLSDRLMQRWFDEGLSEAEARARVDGNDLPNVRFVSSRSREADLVLTA